MLSRVNCALTGKRSQSLFPPPLLSWSRGTAEVEGVRGQLRLCGKSSTWIGRATKTEGAWVPGAVPALWVVNETETALDCLSCWSASQATQTPLHKTWPRWGLPHLLP